MVEIKYTCDECGSNKGLLSATDGDGYTYSLIVKCHDCNHEEIIERYGSYAIE